MLMKDEITGHTGDQGGRGDGGGACWCHVTGAASRFLMSYEQVEIAKWDQETQIPK